MHVECLTFFAEHLIEKGVVFVHVGQAHNMSSVKNLHDEIT